MAAAAPALIERVDPNCRMDSTGSQAASASGDSPVLSWPNTRQQARGSG